MKIIEVSVPHRISGFFQMMDPSISNDEVDLAKIGSRGGGPALTAYGKTKITCYKKIEISDFDDFSLIGNINFNILINGENHTLDANTSISVVDQMKKHLPDGTFLCIEHKFELPLGSGYGSSGCGALGIAYGLNLLFNLGFSDMQVSKFAHFAEVSNHTGLGTVGGQYIGGLSISVDPGYPFKMDRIIISPDIKIIVASWGSISTKNILTDPIYKDLIHKVGKQCMLQMMTNFSLENYAKVCTKFLDETEIMQRLGLFDLKELISTLNLLPIYGAGMNQLGNSVYVFCKNQDISEVNQIIRTYSPKFGPFTLEICNSGPIIERLE